MFRWHRPTRKEISCHFAGLQTKQIAAATLDAEILKCAINLYGVFVPFRVRFTRVLEPPPHSRASRAVKFETVVYLTACKQLYIGVNKGTYGSCAHVDHTADL